jgi:hypothetical protein
VRPLLAALALTALPLAAHGEVVSSDANGFVVKTTVETKLAPQAAFKRFTKIGQWWSPAHTYSHDPKKNFHMDARAGGCWCERVPNEGSVEHMRVLFVAPGQEIRLSGGLGPLQSMAVSAVLDVTFEAEGTGAKVTATYNVGGYMPGMADKIPAAVDGVITEQFARFANAP